MHEVALHAAAALDRGDPSKGMTAARVASASSLIAAIEAMPTSYCARVSTQG